MSRQRSRPNCYEKAKPICKIAAQCCDGRVVSTLEGGYDLDGLAGAVRAHLDVLIAHSEADG